MIITATGINAVANYQENSFMSIDRSLKTMKGLTRHRNVLSRAERIKKLADEDRWEDSQSVFGLPKVANRNLRVGKKTKKKEESAGEGKEETKEQAATDTESKSES